MTKTKQPKPVKAWAIVKDGVLNASEVYHTRRFARLFCIKSDGERIVRVEIKVLK